MFDQLSDKLVSGIKKLKQKGKLSEKDIDEALKQIRFSLLSADVNYKVVKDFLEGIREKALSEEVTKSLTPGQQVVKIINNELTKLLGGKSQDIFYSAMPPTVILLAGVQGSGKTTSAAKLAFHLKQKNKKVMLAACDTHRPAAVEQLKTLGAMINTPVYSAPGMRAEMIAFNALKEARQTGCEVLIIDTAGRQHINEELMDEISAIHDTVKPREVLFALDCMMGQQAVEAASSFNERLGITGYILTKADSDARGGAALSVCYVTGKPIKFIGTGEKTADFEVFHPERIAGRILGMGDVLSMIEKAEKLSDNEKQIELAKKMTSNSFNLADYLEQLEQMEKMGGLAAIMSSLPQGAGGAKNVNLAAGESQLKKTKAVIQSMSLKERTNPSIINASRRKRIAAGSGTSVTDVNKVINSYEQMKKMMKQFKGNKRKFGKQNFPFM